MMRIPMKFGDGEENGCHLLYSV